MFLDKHLQVCDTLSCPPVLVKKIHEKRGIFSKKLDLNGSNSANLEPKEHF